MSISGYIEIFLTFITNVIAACTIYVNTEKYRFELAYKYMFFGLIICLIGFILEEIPPEYSNFLPYILWSLAYLVAFASVVCINNDFLFFGYIKPFHMLKWVFVLVRGSDIYRLDELRSQNFKSTLTFGHIRSDQVRDEIAKHLHDWVEANLPPSSDQFIRSMADMPAFTSSYDGILNEAFDKFDQINEAIENLPRVMEYATICIPNYTLLRVSPTGQKWSDYFLDLSNGYDPFEQLPEELAKKLKNIKLKIEIPPELRVEHQHILAGSGHGKTTLLQNMILEDMDSDATVIVIDSQGDMINKLLRVVDPERLVLVDPTDVEYPVALNLFDVGMDRIEQYSPLEREMATNGVLELFDFVMASLLGSELTSKQSTAFRYVTRLMLTVPGATIIDFLKLFEPGGLAPYREYIDDMGETSQSFFNNEFESSEFKATKKQILRRLYGLLENQTFARMFSNPKTKLNIFEEMNQGKIILINTAADLLKADGSQIMGRFFIAMIAQAAQERASLKDRRRTYLYIDEAHEYFDDTMITILNKARKYELGLIIAHQFLGQLPSKLSGALAANTSIKFAGGLSSEDANVMAKRMFTKPETIQQQPKGMFLAYFKGHETVPYAVNGDPFAGHELATDEEMEEMRDLMRERYAYPASDLKKTKTIRTPKADPDDVEEASAW